MAVITVKPYLDPEEDKIGLIGLGLNAFPGTKKVFQVPVKNGRFLTGFDEKAAYLSYLPEKEREKETKRIKARCKELEALYPHFKICDCSLENEFYNNMLIELEASNSYFDSNNIMDEVKLSIIKTAAKYSSDSFVALNFEEAATSNKDYLYFISDAELDVETEVTLKKKRNKAVALLDEIEDDSTQMRLIIKYLFKPSKQFDTLKSTSLYKKLDDFIQGIVEGEVTKEGKNNHEIFTKVIKMDKSELIAKVVIKYAIYLNIIRQRPDKEYFYTKTGHEFGKTPEEIYNFLTEIRNMDVYNQIKDDVSTETKINS